MLYIYIYIYNNNNKLNKNASSLNSELSVSYTSCYTKVKELRLPYNLFVTGSGKILDTSLFQEYKRYANILAQDLILGLQIDFLQR